MVRQRRFYPPYRVDTWFERDRASVVVYDSRDNVVAEWWDEDVMEMIEQGFFKKGRKFEQSVIDYLIDIGVI